MDHYKNPRYQNDINTPDFISKNFNPSCGDSITFSGKIRKNILSCVSFRANGCVISQASASLLAEFCIKKEISMILAMDYKDIYSLIAIQLGPTRLKCALLPLQALQEGILNEKK